MKQILWYISAGLLAVGNIVQAKIIHDLEQRKPFLESDRISIELATKLYSKEHGTTPEQVMNGRFPVVIRVGDARCVSLKVVRGASGRSPTYCFGADYKLKGTINAGADEIVEG